MHSVNATYSGVQLAATCGRTGTKSADLVATHAGDIGDVPADLLGPVLSQCTAQQLAAIEDETRLVGVCFGGLAQSLSPRSSLSLSCFCRAGGRDIGTDLQPHWHRLLVQKFGAASCLGDSHSSSSGDGDGDGSIAGGDGAWRVAYDAKERERAEKEQRIREKCQRMVEQERTAKQQRCTQVRVTGGTLTWPKRRGFGLSVFPERFCPNLQVIAIQPGRNKMGRSVVQPGSRRTGQPVGPPSIRHSILKKLGFSAQVPAAAKSQLAACRPAAAPSRMAGVKPPGDVHLERRTSGIAARRR